jgi:hypothetical protein
MSGYDSVSVEAVEPSKCRYCHQGIAWFKSHKTGKPYACNVHQKDGDWVASRRDFHNCEERNG